MDGFRFHMEATGLPEGSMRRANAELVSMINSPDPTLQYGGLQMLCDQLTISSFISPTTMATIPMLLPSLIRCIATSPLREVSITAARALTYILDAFPRTFETLPSRVTLVTVLLQHLRSIEDVELSEQCISCLEIISRSQLGSQELLRSDGVEAVLGFADFFTLHKQRQIWKIVHRLVGEMDQSAVRHVAPSLPTLRMAMTNGDAEIRQKAIATMAQAIEGVKGDRGIVEDVFGDSADRIAAVLQERDINDETLSCALSLLLAGVQWSAGIAASVIQSDLLATLLALLRATPAAAAAGGAASATDQVASPTDHADTPAELLLVRDSPASLAPESSPASALRTPVLTSHQRAIVCRLLASLLIPYRSGAAEQLERLEMLTQRSLLTGAPAVGDLMGGQGGDDDDEEAEEDGEDDYTTTEGDEEDEEAVEDFDSDPEGTLAELRQRIADEPGLKIQTKAIYARCRPSGFMCDGCGKSCTPGDWYRCNDCPDKDFCCACVLEHYRDDHNGQHSYTDMEQVVGATARNRDKVELYRQSPQLLQRLLEAVPTVVCVCVASELVTVRAACLNFLVSLADMTSAEQLLGSGATQGELGEVLNNNLRGNDLVCNALATVLAGRLLQKAGDAYQVQFVREGVKLSLQLLRQRCKVKGKTSLSRELRAHLSTSVAGWRTIIGTEAALLLHRFLGTEDEQTSESLRRVVQELRQDNFNTAVALLRDVLAGDVTAFEFYSSGIAKELRSCLSRQRNVFAVMQLIAVLSTPAPPSAYEQDAGQRSASPPGSPLGRGMNGSGSLLSRFVHHLLTVLTLLDDFAVPTYDFIGGVHKYFVVCFEPHRQSVAAPGDSVSAGSAAAQRGAEGDTGSAGRQRIKARIRPLSSVSAMVQVLKQEVLHQESENENDGDDDEAITNVLPNLHPRNTPSPSSSPVNTFTAARRLLRAAANSAAAQTNPASDGPSRNPPPPPPSNSVWIRYGTHVLPLSMTMLQIIEHLVLPAAAAAEARDAQAGASGAPASHPARRAKERAEGSDAEYDGEDEEEDADGGGASAGRRVPRDPTAAAGYSLQRPVMLYYSSAPYNPQHYPLYKVPNSFPASGDPQAPLQVRLPSQDAEPSAVRELRQRLSSSFPYSHKALSESQRDVLAVLGVLHAAVSNWVQLQAHLRRRLDSPELRGVVDAAPILDTFAPAVSLTEFQHPKLNNKAIQQCSQLLLAGQQRGTWAVKLALDCQYLFSYTTRKFLFDASFTSTDRCLIQMRKYRELFGLNEPRISNEQMRGIYGQLKKEAKRVWRSDVLECAKKVLDGQDARTRNSTWSFQFYNENGWGDGPTREFYTLVSQQLRQRKLALWRGGSEAEEHAEYDASGLGLYPKPCVPGSADEQRAVPLFRLIGRFLGRAIVDEHVPGLPLSPVLIRLLRGDVCGVHDVLDISEEVGRLLVAMTEASAAGSDELHLPGQKKTVAVTDLALDFTLPGDDAIELQPGGSAAAVTSGNMLAYCDAVTSFLLSRGVTAAVQALREGFNWYVPLVALQMLTVEEVYQLLAGHETAITRDEFEQHSEANYGYTLHCKHVQWLFDILAAFTLEEQKQFFLFLTGSAHLPVGGLGRLRPSFTIVRKTSEDAAIKEQDLLPSAMTCQNYLKLPQYDSRAEMEKKLRFAMTEGSGAFLLS